MNGMLQLVIGLGEKKVDVVFALKIGLTKIENERVSSLSKPWMLNFIKSSLSTSRLSSTPEFHYNRVKAFLKYDGAMKCCEYLVAENVIPTVWQKAIHLALE